ncbi:MAG TPA: 50S ribosomal protein L7/L12 [Phycisphaerales bacterium]|jgi:large subunit ribosomal protein L7/L12|nr:50S ribosomal protein L7/L12 [Phycisphaerales bacterium]
MSTIQELGDKLAGLSLKDAVELGKYLKDTYGIEAAAGGAVVMAGGGGGGAAAAPAEEKTSFDVILKGSDAAKKIGVIKVVREATGLGLAEAKAFVENPGKPVKTGLPKADADKLKKQLEEAGAQIELA